MFDLAVSTVAQGLMWSILSLGVFLSFRVLDVPDMTCEGSFPLGGAIAATLITAGVSPWASLLAGALGGVVAGTVSGILYTKLKIPAILAGILTMIALYSINLHIMGKANISLLRTDTVFTLTQKMFDISQGAAAFLLPAVICLLLCFGIYWFFGTELGMCIRATGYNVQMMRAQGVNTDTMTIVGLFISNALIGLCVASVIIGEVILGVSSFKESLIAVIIGSVLYRIVIALVLFMGMPPNDLKLFTAVLVMIALAMPMIKENLNMGKAG